MKDLILSSDDLPRERVAVPEWKCEHVWIRALSGTERDAYESSLVEFDERGKRVVNVDNGRARFLVKCIIDESGNRIFSDDDAPALGVKSGAVLDRLYDVARRLSKMRPADAEEAEKN
jgi:hypothetical protein